MDNTCSPLIALPANTARSFLKGRIVEIFSSIQGEGLMLGTPMIFIRFGGCNLRCNYCDEPEALAYDSGKLITQEEIISKVLQEATNWTVGKNEKPLSVTPVKTGIQSFPDSRPVSEYGVTTLRGNDRKWITLTGGEPLLHKNFLFHFIPSLKQEGFKIHLETSGIFHEAIEALSPLIDFISMDIKLPSAVSGQVWWKRHQEFLKVASQKMQVKIVLTNTSQLLEVGRAIHLLKDFPRVILVILQPATPIGETKPPSPLFLQYCHRMAWRNLSQPVRIMPQYHPLWQQP